MATKDLATARSHALFVCDLQPSESPDLDEVRAAIRQTVQTYGLRGCLVRVAQEYGAEVGGSGCGPGVPLG